MANVFQIDISKHPSISNILKRTENLGFSNFCLNGSQELKVKRRM
jgi:hypothetical protein